MTFEMNKQLERDLRGNKKILARDLRENENKSEQILVTDQRRKEMKLK